MWLEPLYDNGTSYSSKVGKQRFKSFGGATDYYNILSGTGIVQHSYTFDVVDVASSVWLVSSTTIVCISYVGVEAR